MIIAALTISIVTLLVSAVVGLAVMELLANGTPSTSTSDQPHDVLTKFELSNGAIGTALSEHGLPRWLDSEAMHVVLFVSPVCSLRDALVGSLKGVVPAGLTLTVTAADPVRQREWASAHDLDLGEVVFDDDRSIVDSLGVTSSPTAIGVEHGKVLFAAAVGGPNALTELLDAGRRIGESPDLNSDKSPESLIGGNDDELSRHKHS